MLPYLTSKNMLIRCFHYLSIQKSDRDCIRGFLQRSKCGDWISLVSEDSRIFFVKKSRTIVSVYLPEAVVAVGVGSIVRIPLKSYIRTNVKVSVDNDRLSKRCSQLFSLLARDFAITPPCENVDHGKWLINFKLHSGSDEWLFIPLLFNGLLNDQLPTVLRTSTPPGLPEHFRFRCCSSYGYQMCVPCTMITTRPGSGLVN